MDSKQQSNPFSTGGGGTIFETRVQAAFVVLMLTGQIAPCLPPWPITKIKLQGRYAGFNTDDFIVFAKDLQTEKEAKLLAQIKHSISITEGNDVFGEVIQAAWNDFRNPDIFTVGNDVFALITGPLSATDINNTRTLLEWARHSDDAKEFFHKVNLANFSSDAKREKLKVFQTHLNKANDGSDISDEQFWEFLKSFYLLGYDLDIESGITLSLLRSLIAQSTTGDAPSLWSRVVDAIQSYNQTSGTVTLAILPTDIVNAFNNRQNNHFISDVSRLRDHGDYIINGIRENIAGVHINRSDFFDQLLEISEGAEFVFLSGERGCGKSSLVREFAEHMRDHVPVFCLRTEDLDKAHLDNVFSAIGLTSSISDLESGFTMIPKKYLLIESLEKLLELQNTAAFTDLIYFIRKHPGWTIIASGRDYAYQQITLHFLQPSGIHYSSLLIKDFSDGDVEYLCKSIDLLKPLSTNESIKALLKKPYYAELAYRIAQTGTQFSSGDGEKEFRIAVWRDVISKEHIRANGMPLRRRQTFIDIALKRAKQMVYGVPEAAFDSDALLKLEEDNLIYRDISNGLVSPAHDVLEDWALERYIEEVSQTYIDDIKGFLDAVGHEPAMNRAFRLWLHQKIRFGENVAHLVLNILNDENIESCWQDETISAILLSNTSYEFITQS
ncbi:MAG: ATP-binding protein [Firmicutes bacterium]|nr:ATP-binding protein [Bacillota bacterium]